MRRTCRHGYSNPLALRHTIINIIICIIGVMGIVWIGLVMAAIYGVFLPGS